MNPVRSQAIEALRRMVLEALGRHDAAVWLFGSCARGAPRAHSDIDVAILPRGAHYRSAFSASSKPTSKKAPSPTMSTWSICGMPTLPSSTRSRREGVRWRG
jgi:hypothetical protein